jgi:hypothetical protein
MPGDDDDDQAGPARPGGLTRAFPVPSRVRAHCGHGLGDRDQEHDFRPDHHNSKPLTGVELGAPVFKMFTVAFGASSRFSDRLIQLVKLRISVSYKVVRFAADAGPVGFRSRCAMLSCGVPPVIQLYGMPSS